LLELKGLEEGNKYSSLVSSSLLVVKLILVETKRGWIQPSLVLFLQLAVFSGFNFLLSVLFSLKRKAKDFFPGTDLASKQALFFFCCLNLAIALQSAVLWLFLSQ
jgi:hypothetical protein